jgi:pyridoxine/pyridoxamine 5'-phosphate oxidase
VSQPPRAPEPTPGRPRMPAAYGVGPAADASPIAWSHVREQLTAARNYWVATTRADGRPHVMPVWGLWHDEAFYFSTDPASQKGRNLLDRRGLAVHLESGDDVVILEGVAERVADMTALTAFADAYNAKYGFRPDPANPDYAVFRLRPRVAHAWTEQDFPMTATRWRFA